MSKDFFTYTLFISYPDGSVSRSSFSSRDVALTAFCDLPDDKKSKSLVLVESYVSGFDVVPIGTIRLSPIKISSDEVISWIPIYEGYKDGD